MNPGNCARIAFRRAMHRFDHARAWAEFTRLSASRGDCPRAVAEQAETDEIEARFMLLRAVLMVADPSTAWHQNDMFDEEYHIPLCSIVAGRRAFSVMPVADGMSRWGNCLDLVVADLD